MQGKRDLDQGCQMVYFQTKDPNLGKFCRGLSMEDVGIGIVRPYIWSTLQTFGIFVAILCTYFIVIWNIFPVWVYSNMKNLATLISTLFFQPG
jgi:hypothetical protein